MGLKTTRREIIYPGISSVRHTKTVPGGKGSLLTYVLALVAFVNSFVLDEVVILMKVFFPQS